MKVSFENISCWEVECPSDENPEQDLVADLSPNGPPSTRRRTPRARSSVANYYTDCVRRVHDQIALSLDFTAAVMSVPAVRNDDDDGDEWMGTDTNTEDALDDSNSSHSEIGVFRLGLSPNSSLQA